MKSVKRVMRSLLISEARYYATGAIVALIAGTGLISKSSMASMAYHVVRTILRVIHF
ncbi:TPA: hypothetical protein ACGWER_001773 [Streptococcus agalactiae]|nr:hypothetical protein [Streptococcus agalactiae]HEO2267421.1 hypothetical protein [Streptococcus agalactiae]